MAKVVSSSNFLIGHVLVVVAYTILALIILWTQFKEKAIGFDNRKVIITCSAILILSNLLALIPVLSETKYTVK
jgi:hypothetical protein